MSADPENIEAVEAKYPNHRTEVVETKCPDCELTEGHLGDCLIGGHQALEIAALKERLSEAEALLFNLRFDICTTNPGIVLTKRIKEINNFLNPPNPADDPNNCLVCMRATGHAIRHTCKQD